jgi:ABC-type branched-subunit amino acid transport system substrate-binding protein
MRDEMLQQIGPRIEGLLSIVDYSWRINTPANKEFVKKFEGKHGKKPDSTNSNAYAVTNAVLEALKVTGGDTSFTKLKEALKKIQFDTPIGRARYSPNGFAISNRFIVQVKKIEGRFAYEPIKTYEGVKDPRE